MKDTRCVDFMQWCLPRLQMRWQGFRKVRSQVCKRVDRRIRELGLESIDAYRARLAEDPNEWDVLDALCRVTISRFYRDRRVFDRLCQDVFPALGEDRLRCWSAGCASGEEPYTLAICLQESGRSSFEILGTDIDEHMLDRARRGCYQRGTLKELPDAWIDAAFTRSGPEEEPYCIRRAYRQSIEWLRHDVRSAAPEGPFDVVLCRNLAFMYFDPSQRQSVLHRLISVLRPGAALVVGKHDVPPEAERIEPWFENEKIYRVRT